MQRTDREAPPAIASSTAADDSSTSGTGIWSGTGRTVYRLVVALGHPLRCRILAALADAQPLDPFELTADVLDVEDETCHEYRIVRHYVHIPLLDDLKYVEWDQETDRIRRGPRYDEVATLAELFGRRDGASDERA